MRTVQRGTIALKLIEVLFLVILVISMMLRDLLHNVRFVEDRLTHYMDRNLVPFVL